MQPGNHHWMDKLLTQFLPCGTSGPMTGHFLINDLEKKHKVIIYNISNGHKDWWRATWENRSLTPCNFNAWKLGTESTFNKGKCKVTVVQVVIDDWSLCPLSPQSDYILSFSGFKQQPELSHSHSSGGCDWQKTGFLSLTESVSGRLYAELECKATQLGAQTVIYLGAVINRSC